MSNGQSPQDPEHAKKIQELQRAKELADAEKGKLDAERGRLEAQKALDAQRSRDADDELKAKTAAATSQKQLAEAEKARIDAQRALEQARKPPDSAADALQAKSVTAKAEKELAEAQKAAADAAKAEADASKAKADADVAAFKARFGDVPTSPYKGEVTLKENAGKTEAVLLATQAMKSAAAAITKEIEANPREVMVIASPDVPTFDSVMRYRVEVGIVEKAFDDMDRLSTIAFEREPADAGKQQQVSRPTRAPMKQRAAVPPGAAAGLALETADKLLGFFRTDYTVGGIDVTVEDATLVNELAGRLARKRFTVYLPKLLNARELVKSSEEVITELEALALRRALSASTLAAHERLTARWTEHAANEADDERKLEMTAAAEAHKHAADAIHKATALYDSWFDKLLSSGEKGGAALIVSVIRERAMMTALDNGRLLLVTKLHAAGGSYYTKKNIWTVFGGMPFFHMGGTVVSFTLIDGKTGAIAAAGTVPVHGGFFKASRLANEIARPPEPPVMKRSWWVRFFRARTTSTVANP